MTKWTVYLSRNCQNCHYYHHYFFLLQCFKKSTMLKSPTNSMKLTYINTMNSLFFPAAVKHFIIIIIFATMFLKVHHAIIHYKSLFYFSNNTLRNQNSNRRTRYTSSHTGRAHYWHNQPHRHVVDDRNPVKLKKHPT